MGAEESGRGRGKVGGWRRAGEGCRGIGDKVGRGGGGVSEPKNVCQKSSHGRLRATDGIGLMVLRKVFFFIVSKNTSSWLPLN